MWCSDRDHNKDKNPWSHLLNFSDSIVRQRWGIRHTNLTANKWWQVKAQRQGRILPKNHQPTTFQKLNSFFLASHIICKLNVSVNHEMKTHKYHVKFNGYPLYLLASHLYLQIKYFVQLLAVVYFNILIVAINLRATQEIFRVWEHYTPKYASGKHIILPVLTYDWTLVKRCQVTC